MTFERGLSEKFIDLLRVEAAKPTGWWREVLDDATLLIGVREEYLNVYWQGQSLFRAERSGEKIWVSTHEKFLLDPDLHGQIRLDQGCFDIESLRVRGFISRFQAGVTLQKMKRAAERFADAEKIGCHKIAQMNATVVDFEVGLPISKDRIDLACFLDCRSHIKLTFWEAKRFANKELRTKIGEPPVVGQIAKYTKWITNHQSELEKSYRRIAQNLTSIQAMGWNRKLSASIKAVAEGVPLSLDSVPVGLLMFEFDEDQKLGAVRRTKEKLNGRIDRIFAIGKASGIRLPAIATDRVKDETPPQDDSEDRSEPNYDHIFPPRGTPETPMPPGMSSDADDILLTIEGPEALEEVRRAIDKDAGRTERGD